MRVDGFGRDLPFEQLALPYPSLVDWRHVMLDVRLAEVDTLLERLMSIPPAELERRTRYVRRIAPHLLFDRTRGQPDAADAFVRELERKLSGPSRTRGRGS